MDEEISLESESNTLIHSSDITMEDRLTSRISNLEYIIASLMKKVELLEGRLEKQNLTSTATSSSSSHSSGSPAQEAATQTEGVIPTMSYSGAAKKNLAICNNTEPSRSRSKVENIPSENGTINAAKTDKKEDYPTAWIVHDSVLSGVDTDRLGDSYDFRATSIKAHKLEDIEEALNSTKTKKSKVQIQYWCMWA